MLCVPDPGPPIAGHRGLFRGGSDLKAAVERHLGRNNADPNPFSWAASAAHILEKFA